jgi:hypothetical protein
VNFKPTTLWSLKPSDGTLGPASSVMDFVPSLFDAGAFFVDR